MSRLYFNSLSVRLSVCLSVCLSVSLSLSISPPLSLFLSYERKSSAKTASAIYLSSLFLSRFGWFGMDKDSISQVGLNYGGVVLSARSILLYVLVKDEISSNKRRDIEVMVKAPSEASPLLLEVNKIMDNMFAMF